MFLLKFLYNLDDEVIGVVWVWILIYSVEILLGTVNLYNSLSCFISFSLDDEYIFWFSNSSSFNNNKFFLNLFVVGLLFLEFCSYNINLFSNSSNKLFNSNIFSSVYWIIFNNSDILVFVSNFCSLYCFFI